MSESNNEHQRRIDAIKNDYLSTDEYFILHLDDEEPLRILFTDCLSEFGIKTLSARDGDEALQILAERSHQIILIASDIKMPKMDGFELRRQTSLLYPDIPFCIVSAYVDRDMALRGVELKINAFIAKPFTPEKLSEVILKEAIPYLKLLKEDRELKLSFISDSENLIEESEDILLRLEQDSNDLDALNRFYAIMHTLKGASAFFEPKDLHKFTHAYEDILKKLQNGELKYTNSVMTVLFKGFDVIKELFNEFKKSRHPQREFETLLDVLKFDSLGATGPHLTAQTATVAKSTHQASKDSATTKTQGTEDIKVSVKLLDEFIQLSGEVTVIRNMLNKCVGSIERRYAGDRDVGMLSELLSELHKINSGVQNKMTEIRKVSLKSVVRVLPRAVRDVAKSLNKKVELHIEGDDLRVDTSIAEVLNNSMLHIIKNSVDHGLEQSEKRLSSGKSENGNIWVKATTRDDKVIVEIKDDGQGLNLEAIKSKLIKNGTHTDEQVNAMTANELYLMIFSSGFSTAQQVTEISGRGVGMSMVKDCVDAIGGQIHIDSVAGKGATFKLVLPVPKSVLIASCLGVRIGKKRFSLVQDDIIRVIQFDTKSAKAHIQELEKSKCLLFENELIPIANLNEMLDLNEKFDNQDFHRLVVMQSGQDNRRMAIEVSEILDVEDMVIKNMHTTLNTLSFYRGVTFLDDGGVGLILNTNGLLDALHISQDHSKTRKQDVQKIATSTAEHQDFSHNVLTVNLGNSGIYAIPQENIFRIEEFKASQIKKSGSSKVISYRGTVLKIVPLKQFATKTKSKMDQASFNDELTKCFVINHGTKYIGFHVDDVLDMVNYSELKTDLEQPELAIKGHFFLGDKTVALLDVEKIVQKANSYTEDFGEIETSTAEIDSGYKAS